MSESSTISQALEARILRLEGRVQQAAGQARRRQFITAAAMAGILAATSGYLWYLYSTIAEYAEAKTVVELAAAQIEPQLNVEASRFGDMLEAQAPFVFDQAEKMMLDAPPRLARRLQDYVGSFLDKHLASLQSQTYDVVRGTLDGSIAKAQEQGVDITDERQLDTLVKAAGPVIRAELKKQIDKLYMEYAAGADNVAAFIQQLVADGGGEKLSALQQSQRDVLLTGLAIIKKLELDPSRGPVQKVIDSLK
ncbi:hypothetical protein EBR56_03525 [bacterium]|nr:hypothetical protein [bacterium]